MDISLSSEQIQYILSPQAIRERCGKVYQLALEGKTHFQVHLERLEQTTDFVLEVIQENYPDLSIPFHSRWGHFSVGENDRVAQLESKISDRVDRANAKFDLVIVSVLLDAGAGMQWKFKDEDGNTYDRSEGLAVASLRMFESGLFSSNKETPYQVDSARLATLTLEELATGFQVSESNPIVGLEGRLKLLKGLGTVLTQETQYFGDSGRPSGLISFFHQSSSDSVCSAPDLLDAVLKSLGGIWPSRLRAGNTPLGDVWKYSGFSGNDDFDSLVAFHKLSQWLTYSLIEPIEDSGLKVKDVASLTGLAEYRNGGLLIDDGVIELRNPSLQKNEHLPNSDLIIEWRALTIVLLDEIGRRVQSKLNKTPEEFPLAKVLEGGTWWAGRKKAKALREDGGPPLKIKSDGTVF